MNESIKEYIRINTAFTSEAAEILGVGRTQINNLVSQKKLIPIKTSATAQLFLVDDLLDYKARKNNDRKNIKMQWIYTTGEAENYWNEQVLPIAGKIVGIRIYENPYYLAYEGVYYCKTQKENELNEFDSPNIVIDLSDGTSIWIFGWYACGYGGAGPTTACKCLEKIGVPEELTKRIPFASRASFVKEEDKWDEIWALKYLKYQEKEIENSYLDAISEYEINTRTYIYNGDMVKLILRKGYAVYSFVDMLETYKSFIPNPVSITVLSEEDAINTGHYVMELFRKKPLQIVIKDVSGRQIWLDYRVDEFRSINEQKALYDIFVALGIDIPDKRNIPAFLREFFNIRVFVTGEEFFVEKEKNKK